MTELVCPECQFKNDPDSTYCEECGAVLNDGGKDKNCRNVAAFTKGQLICGRFQVAEVLRDSSCDASFLARDKEDNGRMVFIRQYRVDDGMEKEFERLKKLFGLIMNNPHPNVANPLGVFKDCDSVFVALEHLKGENLLDIISKEGRSFEQDELKNMAVEAAEGINSLHSLGILHLDVQPAHFILTGSGVLKLTGFSRITSVDETPTDFTVTEGFSPPEAYGLVGGQICRHSDIYSLGATLYSLVTGRTPKLSRENFFVFQPLNDTDVLIDPVFEQIIMKAVKKEPSQRFKNMESMLTALAALRDKEDAHKPRAAQSLKETDLEFEVVARSHLGKVRSVNQDSCLVTRFAAYEKSKPSYWDLLVVADGMGGEAEGDKASSLAIRVIAQEVMNSFMPINVDAETMRLYSEDDIQDKSQDILKRAVLKANHTVFEYSRQDSSRRGMGATISSALIMKNNLCICHAGDTRGYVFSRQLGLIQITEDHSLVGRLVRLGQLTREEALRSPQRSAVYRALGTTPDLEVDIYNYTIRPGDIIMLCSDGVWEYFPDRELISIILEEAQPAKIADRLINTCLERGADDNATIIVYKAKGSADGPKTLRLDERVKVIPAAEVKPEPKESKPEKTEPSKAAMDKRKKEELEKKRFREEMEKKRASSSGPDTPPDLKKPATTAENASEGILSLPNISIPIRQVKMEESPEFCDDSLQTESSLSETADKAEGPDTEPLEITREVEEQLTAHGVKSPLCFADEPSTEETVPAAEEEKTRGDSSGEAEDSAEVKDVSRKASQKPQAKAKSKGKKKKKGKKH